MTKLLTSLFLLLFLSQIGKGQGLNCNKSIGGLFSWSARQNTIYENGTRDFRTFKSSFLQISPFFSRRYYKRWEFGVRGAFIWNRRTEIEQKRNDIFVEKMDVFSLSGGITTRFYFDYPEQNMRTFLLVDNQLIFEIGENEISDVGALVNFGIGVMYQFNPKLALETKITTRLLSLNVVNLNSVDLGLRFWLGFRYCLNQKSTP